MKIILIAALFSLCLIFQINCKGYLDVFHSKNISSYNDMNEYKDECLAEFISHSLNMLDRVSDNQCSKEIISRYGKNDIFEPILLNYLFLIEGDAETLYKPSNKESVSLDFDVCVDSKSESCLLNKLLNITDLNSLVNKQKTLFGNEKLSYLYTTQPFLMPELHLHSISLFVTKDNTVTFVDGEGKIFHSLQSLQACANDFLKNQYEFSGNNVFKFRSSSKIAVSDKNKGAIELLKKDLCMLSQFSKMIRNDGKPNLFAFYIQSLQKLSNVLNQDEMNLASEMFNVAKAKFVSSLQRKYKKEELLGETLFINTELQSNFQGDFQLPSISTAQARVLETTYNTNYTIFKSDEIYQTYVWTPVVLVFIVFFSVMALLSMDFSKDTLLYAKFLTNDAR